MLTTGQRLKSYRKQYGLSRDELSELIHCHPTAIHYWEEDKRIPRSDLLYRLSVLYNVSMEYLLTGKETTER